jgi:hypothetical protein
MMLERTSCIRTLLLILWNQHIFYRHYNWYYNIVFLFYYQYNGLVYTLRNRIKTFYQVRFVMSGFSDHTKLSATASFSVVFFFDTISLYTLGKKHASSSFSYPLLSMLYNKLPLNSIKFLLSNSVNNKRAGDLGVRAATIYRSMVSTCLRDSYHKYVVTGAQS